MRWTLIVLALVQLLLVSNTAAAQKDSASQVTTAQTSGRAWIAPVGIAASVLVDPEVREWSLREHSHSLDRLAKAVNPIGTARRLVPAMALTYAAALLTHREFLANGTLNTAAAYVTSDLVESALKPAIGRERPHVEGNSHRFHPFTTNGDWHSMPSAHVAHIASIAEAISMQAHSSPITGLCSGLVALVAWDRVYEDEHWTSDVAATIALSTAISRVMVHWLESRAERR
jgi:hypothetical protein